jgi:hypothetical protein
MKKYTICIILNLLIFNIYAQNIDFSQFKINKNEIKGKLILINETHSVPTNNLSYYLIIKELTKDFTYSDTLNIFTERPYSYTLMFNKILQNEDTLRKLKWTDFLQNKLPINALLDSLVSLKKNIRFIGVDFEYNEGKSVKSYKYFFETLRDEFAKASLSTKELGNYIQKIDDKSISKKDIKALKEFLKSIPSRTKSISDALFILEAKHKYFGYRDKNIYERFKQIIERSIDVKNQYNLLIYGGVHTNPSRPNSLLKNLFALFDKDKESPFLGNTFLIANYYFDCTSYGFYGSKEPQKENEGLYGLKGDKIVITELKKKDWKSGLFGIKNDLTLPLQSFNKILYFLIHQE